MTFSTAAVQFPNGDALLNGTIWLPQDQPIRKALVMLQGSGASDRHNMGYFPAIRADFIEAGIAVLCYDKPGTGNTAGDWHLQTFEDRAEEALCALRFFRQQGGLQAVPIGLWGHSQGGWIAPLAAVRSPHEVAFVVCNSGPGVSVSEQCVYEYDQILRAAAFSETDMHKALIFAQRLYALASAPEDNIEQVYDLIRSVAGQPWSQLLPKFNLEMKSEDWQYTRRIAAYDPLPVLQQLTCPLLAIFGERDVLVPVQKSVAIFEEALRQAGNPDFTIKVFPDADHRLQIGEYPLFAPGYLSFMYNWIVQH